MNENNPENADGMTREQLIKCGRFETREIMPGNCEVHNGRLVEKEPNGIALRRKLESQRKSTRVIY